MTLYNKILIICCAGVRFYLTMMAKSYVTQKNHNKINMALYRYIEHSIYTLPPEEMEVERIHALWDSIEPFDRTLWRVWDWSDKNIVPPDLYAKIKPYIKRG